MSEADSEITGRDAEGAFKTLAVDLRKLRNILEDIEEATPDESHGKTFAQVPQCKAILLGLDLTLQSGCSLEQQNSRSQSVLTAKASVQIMTSCLAFALDTVPRRSPHEVDLTHDMPTDGGAARRSVESNASNDGTLSTDRTAATTNTISSNRSSARIVSLESGHLSKMSVISLQAIVNG